MALKALSVLVLAVLVSQGHSLTENRLDDVSRTYETNPLLGMGIGIEKWMFDLLESCYVILPNGLMVEAFPEDKIPYDTINFSYSASPFTSCGIAFRDTPVSLSGTYELLSLVNHTDTNTQSLTRQRFHVNIVDRGWIWPSNGDANVKANGN